MKKSFAIIAISTILLSCAGISKIDPSYTFKLLELPCAAGAAGCLSASKLIRHPTSSIGVKEGAVIRLSVDSAYLAELSEKSASSLGQIGNRELMLYAKIYKNGQLLKYKKITDIAEHMAAYQPVVVQNPVFFTETIDASYHIILKGYEVDTKTLVKTLRRVRSTDVDSIEKSDFSPGDTFTTGLKDVVFGVFDMVLSVTGKSLDDWAANMSATKVFEHSVYITPGIEDQGTEKLLILGSGTSNYFVAPNMTSDAEINKHVRSKLKTLEAASFVRDDLINGKDTILSGSPYLILTAERLTAKPQR